MPFFDKFNPMSILQALKKPDIKNDFDKFLNDDSRPNNTWLEQPEIKAYVRKNSMVMHNHQLYPTLDISNVTVPEEHEGKGYFRDFIQHVEKRAAEQGKAVHVENVLNPDLEDKLQKNGYEKIDSLWGGGGPASYIKPVGITPSEPPVGGSFKGGSETLE